MVSLSVSGSLLPSADSAPRRALVRQALRLSQSMAPKKDGRKEALKERHRLAAEAKARGQIIVNDAAIDAVNEATAGPSWVLAMDAEHSTREEDMELEAEMAADVVALATSQLSSCIFVDLQSESAHQIQRRATFLLIIQLYRRYDTYCHGVKS